MGDAEGDGMEAVAVPAEIGGIWCHYKGDRIELELFPLDAVSDENSADDDPPDAAPSMRVWMPRQQFYDSVVRMTSVASALRRMFKE